MSLSDHNFPAADDPFADNEVLAGARDRVTALLADRFADGTLTLEEYDARLNQLRVAKTASELNRLMRDLVIPPTAPIAAAVGREAAWAPASFDRTLAHGGAESKGRMIAILGETKRTGRWVMPRQLEMRMVLGEVLIDLRDAVLPAGECELALVGLLGRVRVLVPPGVMVDSTMDSLLSTVRNATEHDEARHFGQPVIRLTGTAMLTEVLVRVAPAGESPERAWKRAKPKRRRD